MSGGVGYPSIFLGPNEFTHFTVNMTSFKLFAPAKINLYLAVLGRRKDGYHDLCTLFQRINLCDELSVRVVKRKPKTVLGVSGYKLSKRRGNYASYLNH